MLLMFKRKPKLERTDCGLETECHCAHDFGHWWNWLGGVIKCRKCYCIVIGSGVIKPTTYHIHA